ncbi:unnamed protein product [Vitrella brassicaformis CCMP3155]|uniref:ZZ-type domain-containing protein n=1 Tax=Vitrella brassicaformis (strain CCMP3155) TaxID=1169540 RepID=A0A0G4GLF3_VITBC|nr:unnamed protein product [Vitrella brassicaformis CCMP3155]|eukprot:CEM30960.1 unnamed protein product [Vitrella brassicaformis CCMP3155]
MMDSINGDADEPKAKRRHREDQRSSDGSTCDATDVKLLKYHCDSCHVNFSSSVRVKCAECKNLDLCVECFSRGIEKGEHKSWRTRQRTHAAHMRRHESVHRGYFHGTDDVKLLKYHCDACHSSFTSSVRITW